MPAVATAMTAARMFRILAPILLNVAQVQRVRFLEASQDDQLQMLRRWSTGIVPLRLALMNDDRAEALREKTEQFFISSSFDNAVDAANMALIMKGKKARPRAAANPFMARYNSPAATARPRNELPEGFEIEEVGGKHHIFYAGHNTGKYALTAGKAHSMVAKLNSMIQNASKR